MRCHNRLSAVLAALSLTAVLGPACDLSSDVLNVPIEFDTSFAVRADLGQATGAAAGQQAPADASYPLGLGAVPVDLLAASSKLASSRDKVRAIELTEIRVVPSGNTLTAATPPIDLYVGPAGATAPEQGVKIATLPAIPAGSTQPAQGVIDAAGQEAAQPYLLSFDFTFLPVATLGVKAGEAVPGGAVDLQVTTGIKATFNPLGR